MPKVEPFKKQHSQVSGIVYSYLELLVSKVSELSFFTLTQN